MSKRKRHYIPSQWSPVKSLQWRETGICNNHMIRNSANSSKSFWSRLKLVKNLEFHEGCVNAVSFNASGNLIASGSDDFQVAIWDWARHSHSPVLSYGSGHNGNVFQTKFMPFSNDNIIVSCARDGQVRVGYISSAGQLLETKKIVQHKGAAHKLSVEENSPFMFKTAGEDGVVYNIDLRESKHTKLLTLHNEKGSKVALYTIHINPCNEYEFAVAGRDHWARIFDTRKIKDILENGAVKRFCPDSLKDKEHSIFSSNITCLMYNYNGNELLCSYNDENIYLFDLQHSSESNSVHSYSGHRNSETVKGVNFIGPYSEYVVSGSDCGHVFIWEKQSEEIITFVEGDSGVVNVLEPHPNSCILATAGLDHDVKIWHPTGDPFVKNKEFEDVIKENNKKLLDDRSTSSRSDIMLMMLQQVIRQRRRRPGSTYNRPEGATEDEENTSSSGDDGLDGDLDDLDDDDDDDTPPSCVQA